MPVLDAGTARTALLIAVGFVACSGADVDRSMAWYNYTLPTATRVAELVATARLTPAVLACAHVSAWGTIYSLTLINSKPRAKLC